MKVEENIDWDRLIEATEGYSGADLANLCRDAAYQPLRRMLKDGKIDILKLRSQEDADLKKDEIEAPLTMDDFLEALKNTQKSVSQDMLETYEKWMAEFGA